MTKYLGIAMVLVCAALWGGLHIGCADDTGNCPGGVCPDDGDTDNGDADNDSSSCSSDDPAPVVAFVRPTDGAEVIGAQTVEISVVDRCGVDEVTLSVDGAVSQTWTSAPYTWTWDTSGLVSGNHTLTANVTDIAEQTASATIEVDVRAECRTASDCPPRVRIVYPTAGSRVCGTLNVEATATGEDDIAEVEFQVDHVSLGTDSNAPYQAEWITTGLADGDHILTATARDTGGQEARHTVSVETENSGGACDNLPTAVITEPEDGGYVYGDITVRVIASDDIGVVRVRVFVDAGMIWEDVTTPFEGVWHTADFTEGPHLIRAEATDTADQQSAESSLEVDVDRTPPTITITAPSDGETVSGTRIVVANATDNLSVASVAFTATGGISRSFTDTEAPFEWSLDFPPAASCDDDVTIEAEATDHAGWIAADTVTVILAPATEICNGLDDDCDGSVDEDFACRAGAAESCTTSCGSTGTRSCSTTCTWGATCTPPIEVCNGLDDDCDGVPDNSYECTLGATEPCTTPTSDPGNRQCGSTCAWGMCQGANIGSPCASVADCYGGPGATCLTTVAGIPFTGGYCSTDCDAGGGCGSDGYCVDATTIGGTHSCFDLCSTDYDCRWMEGYVCTNWSIFARTFCAPPR